MTDRAPISKRELKTSAAVLVLLIGGIIVSSILLVTSYWFLWPIITVCLLVAVGYFSASKYSYQCPNCKKEFKITVLQDFFAPHGISRGPSGELYEWKLLKCPSCGSRSKCFRVESAKAHSVNAE
jgi:DNA-directed RNA polymerase subunit RPC12/RpoP